MTTESRLWPLFAICVITLVLAASLAWILDHPYAISWDEAAYFNQVLQDNSHIEQGRSLFFGAPLLYFAGSMLLDDTSRPPAYRVFVAPFIHAFGFSPLVVRVVSLGFLVVTFLLVYLAGRHIAGPAAGAFAAIFISLCPDVVFANMVFGTEYPLCLATAGLLYFTFRDRTQPEPSLSTWVGLGFSLALGALSKTSFLLIAPLIWLLPLALARRGIVLGPTPKTLIRGAILGVLLAAPWWLLNVRSAISFAQNSSRFVRHSPGALSLNTFAHWVSAITQAGLGLPLAILSILVLFASALAALGTLNVSIGRRESWAALVCFLAGVPLILFQLIGTNFNLRHLIPALILFAVGLGVLAARTQWTAVGVRRDTVWLLFGVQLIMIWSPLLYRTPLPSNLTFISAGPPWLVLARLEQWDWSPLRQLCRARGITFPAISVLGNGRGFNSPQIVYQWAMHSDRVKEVRWLWQYEDGPPHWDQILKALDESDIVLTAPNYVGALRDKEPLDNQYNADFARWLADDPRFEGPVRLPMGRLQSTEILAFINRNHRALSPLALGDDVRAPEGSAFRTISRLWWRAWKRRSQSNDTK